MGWRAAPNGLNWRLTVGKAGLLGRRGMSKMPRFGNFAPKGVIPATLLPFNQDFSIIF